MIQYSITRRNPRTGRIERPWRNRDGFFVLGDPAHGAQKHHDRFAVKVDTMDEVIERIRKGFSVRMTDGESPPSLISPDSLVIEEVTDHPACQLWAETSPKPAFTKATMLDELRKVLLVQANQIVTFGRLEHAEVFIGFPPEDPAAPYLNDDPASIDLARFAITDRLEEAYDYAFQVDAFWRFSGKTAGMLQGILHGYAQRYATGEASPMLDESGLCRHVCDMALARWDLDHHRDLSARKLALLAGMTEAAVRSSLSKEQIAILRGLVVAQTAADWLKQRRGFTPTRETGQTSTNWAAWARTLLDREGLDVALATLLKARGLPPEALSKQANVPAAFIADLLKGKPPVNVPAMEQVGGLLDLDVPHFVGIAVQAALRSKNDNSGTV